MGSILRPRARQRLPGIGWRGCRAASHTGTAHAYVGSAYVHPGAAEVPAISADGLDLKEHLAQLEVQLIQQALDSTHGVVAHAAKLLKMRRTTLVEKLRKYGLQRSDDAPSGASS